MSSLVLTERTVGITMEYNGERGHRGYKPSADLFTHTLFLQDIGTEKQTNKDVATGGPVPITNVLGMKIPVIQIQSKFHYSIDDIYDVLLPALAPYRLPGCNTVKNIFLVGSILTVVENGNGIFSELPIGSKWYVKKFKASRNTTSPDRLSYSLILWRWYK